MEKKLEDDCDCSFVVCADRGCKTGGWGVDLVGSQLVWDRKHPNDQCADACRDTAKSLRATLLLAGWFARLFGQVTLRAPEKPGTALDLSVDARGALRRPRFLPDEDSVLRALRRRARRPALTEISVVSSGDHQKQAWEHFLEMSKPPKTRETSQAVPSGDGQRTVETAETAFLPTRLVATSKRR